MPDKHTRDALAPLTHQEIGRDQSLQMVNCCGHGERKQQQQQPGAEKQRQGTGRAGQVSFIIDGLYLSGARAVRQARLTELGVTCVVNSTVELPTVPLDGVEVVPVRVSDAPDSDLAVHFDSISDKIQDVRGRGGRVLVHCVAGVSRSPALVLAYLVKYADMSLRQAFFHVRSARPNIRPNAGFFSQLIDFEERVRGSTSVTLVKVSNLGLTVPDVCEDELKVLRDTRWARMIRERRNFERLYA
ncbi:dual specificity protein phosphatase 18 [Procambarus clarkii]|uniref:dual specificity protein phosphatase 18 n=1 Tax=Procambarus clarkii TaxID=6728 RepID=UPI001E678ADC|nr:dual specificity protein phosphatase 18-like [Procambarus clarkii]